MAGQRERPRRRASEVERRLDRLRACDFRQGALVAFHTTVKLELLARSPEAYRALGRLVATAPSSRRSSARAQVAAAYARELRAALALPRSRGREVNALQHAAGFVSARLDDGERRALTAAIDDYAAGRAPRGRALALLRRHARRHDVAWLGQQLYLGSAPRRPVGGGR